MALNLLSNMNRVETPFIIANIGGYTFGAYDKNTKNIIDESGYNKKVIATYPNFMKQLTVTKINGAVNTYSLDMDYAIRNGDDPNFLDKILSQASKDRQIILSYGDFSSPTYIYKEEKAILTNITSNFSFESSKISYHLSATSDSLSLTAGNYFFNKRVDKPSNIIKEILYDNRYGVLEVFYGMRDRELVMSKGLIAGDDKVVTIEAQSNISVFDYFQYLLSCMTSAGTQEDSLITGNKYILTVYDDVTGQFGGPYFKVQKVARNVQELNSIDTYEIDIGFPVNSNVISFSIDDNQAYSILYDYADKAQLSDYNYRINDKGQLDYIYSPVLGKKSEFYKITEADRTWWTKVTQYPISATLTIKGLLRPAMLMTYLKINTYFYGRKHNSSGTYIVTKQVDNISSSGYRTTLSLKRIAGDTL